MVFENRGIQDPEPGSEDLTPNQELTPNVGEPDTSDDETQDYQGYQPLPLNDFVDTSNSEGEENTVGEVITPASSDSLPPIIPVEEDLVREVWSKPPPKAVDIEMDSTKVDEVKRAMINITLPESSIPAWASTVPESEWKQTLMARLQKIQSDNTK